MVTTRKKPKIPPAFAFAGETQPQHTEATISSVYGARYLDARTSRWISADPALGEYVPAASLGDEERKHNQNLPGMGGVFNVVNLHVYHYAANNPVKYVDPDGEDIILLVDPDGAPAPGFIGDFLTFGHSAALIGNDEDGWLFYSNNGPNGISIGEFTSIDEFLEQYNSQEKHFNFTREQRLVTTPEQDQRMKEKALELAGINIDQVRVVPNRFLSNTPHPESRIYRTLTNNCSQHIAIIASAGGQHSINSLIPNTQLLMNPETYRYFSTGRMLRYGW